MTTLHGHQLIGKQTSAESQDTFTGFNPATSEALPSEFHEASAGEIDRAMGLAAKAFDELRHTTVEQRAAFLETIADEVDALGDPLLEQADRALYLAKSAGRNTIA